MHLIIMIILTIIGHIIKTVLVVIIHIVVITINHILIIMMMITCIIYQGRAGREMQRGARPPRR